jgi:hypothetical protein
MDTLPVELLRLILEYGDATAARAMRLVTRTLAEVGYDYMLPSHFKAAGWKDDISRLHNIATHERLSTRIGSATFNFSDCRFCQPPPLTLHRLQRLGRRLYEITPQLTLSTVDEWSAQHVSYFQNFRQKPTARQILLQDAWSEYDELDQRRNTDMRLDERLTTLRDCFRLLKNLRQLTVTYSTCPYDIEVVKNAFRDVYNCRRVNRDQMRKDLTALVSAMAEAEITSFAIDHVPLDIFGKSSAYRPRWFEHGPDAFRHLERLDLTLDPSKMLGPSSEMKAMLGLGRTVQFAGSVRHLSLAFQSHSAPRTKVLISFVHLFGDFTFGRLTDLRLEGISCDEQDLREFLVRHGATLERLRLGGRGLAKPYEQSIGGIHLCAGTFKALFVGLRAGLPRLQRLHLEGDFETPRALGHLGEVYRYGAVTDDEWKLIPEDRRRLSKTTISCLAIEHYVLCGGPYPGPAQLAPATAQ